MAIARAIVREPAVFLFDEPLSNLDAKLRVAMRAEIKALHQRLKTTTVYVTHDQIEAMTMADKIVVMHDGIVEQIGAPLDLYDAPANLFVAGFIGSPAMNMIPGRIDPLDPGRFVADDGAVLPVPRRLAAAPERAIYGLRPESLRLGGDLGFVVEVVEPTGSETHVVGRLAGMEVVGVFRERIGAQPGESIGVSVDAAATHVFDAVSGDRVSA